MGFPAWEPAVRCTSGPQPGAQAFMRWFVEEYGDEGGMNWGIYNCRDVRGGSTTSLHGEGRACDCGFAVGDPDGDELLKRLLKVPGRLGIQCIIYERTIYSAKSPGGRYYDGVAPHYDHLHVEFTWEAAKNLTYTTVKRVMALTLNKPGTRNLHVGMQGADVAWVQKKLRMANVDGVFGPHTEEKVKNWEIEKRKQYPRLKADGIVGHLTWVTFGISPRY